MFLALLDRTVRERGWSCWNYCLMDTHVHLVVRTPQPDLANGMQRLNGDFALRVNRRRGSRGAVFDGRYGSRLLAGDVHLAEVLRYVALNPTRAGLCKQPSAWRWSGHRALAGEIEPPGFLAVGEVHALVEGMFGRVGPSGYVSLVQGARDAAHVETAGRLAALVSPPEPSLETLAADGSAGAIRTAHRDHGYSLRRIAEELGISPSTASRRLRCWEAAQRNGSDPRATQRV